MGVTPMHYQRPGQSQPVPEASGPGSDLGIDFQLRYYSLGWSHTPLHLRRGRKPSWTRPDCQQVQRRNQRARVP